MCRQRAHALFGCEQGEEFLEPARTGPRRTGVPAGVDHGWGVPPGQRCRAATAARLVLVRRAVRDDRGGMTSTDANNSSALLLRGAETEILTGDPGGTIALLADTDALTANRSTFSRGADGAPPHFHTTASELLVVLEGTLDVLLDEQVTTLVADDVLLLPPRMPHAFGAAAGAEAEVLFVFTPGIGRFEYYRLLDRVHRGLADAQEIRESSARFDNHYVESATWRRARG